MMEVIVIESKDFEELLKHIEERLEKNVKNTVKEETAILIDEVRQTTQKIDITLRNEAIDNLPIANITPEEACRILKCSKRSLHYYKKKGILKYYKQEGRIFFKLSDLQGFLETKSNVQLPSIL